MPTSSGLHILQDSGVPDGSTEYTTLVLLHGYAWHSGILSKLLPLAKQHNARIILVNRRDYPGTRPYSEEERALLPVLSPEGGAADAAEMAEAKEKLLTFMKGRAREVYDLLVELVTNEDLPPAQPEENKGGIVVAGWSFGSAWMTALLAHVASFGVNDVDLSAYVRRVVFLDPAYHTLGYPHPARPGYNPLLDPEVPLEERGRWFSDWVSGYYIHGDTFETLEQKTPLQHPPPTLSTLTPEEVEAAQYLPPIVPGGSDVAVFEGGLQLGLFTALKDGALYLPSKGNGDAAEEDGDDEDDPQGNAWPNVEVRYVHCENSVWHLPWGTWALKKEVEEAKQKGLPIRNVRMVHIRGANHFVPWDATELALRALLGDEDEVS
ncbi:hypothetical protein OH77DRAFT_1405139 [Trametes cingulata]|nr:hypothetical protein OH77DRAFT_1405139 [Trametes cingulata]